MSDLVPVLTPEIKKKLIQGQVTANQIVELLTPKSESIAPVPKVPEAPAISKDQAFALQKLTSIFGAVAPTTARALEEMEVERLMDERLTLDQIADLVGNRKDDIRTIILNHIDSTTEEDVPLDKDGHKLRATKVGSYEGKTFSWEVREGSGTIDAARLQELDEAGEIDHEDFLAITEPVRVVNETKLMTALKKKPELLEVLGKAVTKKNPVGSMNVRNA